MQQLALSRRFDFALVFEQFGFDMWQAEIPVDFVFRPPGDAACAVEQPVVVEFAATVAAIWRNAMLSAFDPVKY